MAASRVHRHQTTALPMPMSNHGGVVPRYHGSLPPTGHGSALNLSAADRRKSKAAPPRSQLHIRSAPDRHQIGTRSKGSPAQVGEQTRHMSRRAEVRDAGEPFSFRSSTHDGGSRSVTRYSGNVSGGLDECQCDSGTRYAVLLGMLK